jgi:hypothetical protein
VIELESRAVIALSKCSMTYADASRRFVGETLYMYRVDSNYKLTARQALFLWRIVYTFRRQVQDADLLMHAAYAKKFGALPDIYLLSDHRVPVVHGVREEAVVPKEEPAPAAAPAPGVQKSLFEAAKC